MSAATKEHGFKHATPCNTSGILVEGADNYHHNFSIELCQRYGFDSEVSFHYIIADRLPIPARSLYRSRTSRTSTLFY